MDGLPKLDRRVIVWGAPRSVGRVVGFATVLLNKHISTYSPTTLVVIELDEGFYLVDGIFNATTLAHPENLEYET